MKKFTASANQILSKSHFEWTLEDVAKIAELLNKFVNITDTIDCLEFDDYDDIQEIRDEHGHKLDLCLEDEAEVYQSVVEILKSKI